MSLAAQIDLATSRIAPNWPLDQLIAVNPYWGWIDRPMPEAAALLGTLGGTRLTMPRPWFREQRRAGRLGRAHLLAAVDGDAAAADALLAALDSDSPAVPRLPLVTDLRDAGAPPWPGQRWTDLVTHQTSQHCAAFHAVDQGGWTLDTAPGLYDSWRRQLGADLGVPWRRGRAWLHGRLDALPAAPPALIGAALDALGIADNGRAAYLGALLMSVGGWAAWCAYERWQARLNGGDDDRLVHLLAIRLAWEWLLHDDAPPGTVPSTWGSQWSAADALAAPLHAAQRTDWLLQSAAEIAFQQPLVAQLKQPLPPAKAGTAAVHAVFCIDVRSELVRRALEAVDPTLTTRGFAGFFGLPIAYRPLGTTLTRPQLPGLLAPAQCITERADDGEHALGQHLLTRRRGQALGWQQRWTAFRATPASAFSFVESIGLLYGLELLADGLGSTRTAARWEDTGLPGGAARQLRPCLPQTRDDPAAAAALAHGILVAMGLTEHFAPLVLLCGHASRSANNPQAAALDCGACGGHSGEVNARALADLLNAAAVRDPLRALGIDIPACTHFLAALHDTTTDEITLFDSEAVPAPLQPALATLQQTLAAAGERVRAERAGRLGLGDIAQQPAALKRALSRRANDWSQLRPEWGLADNAALIVAPRRRTRHLNLEGRAFLHDFEWRSEDDLPRLTAIMTAPMVVAHWINMQYHASTVDNRRYGSGNKTLHNVVAGRIGVFEGNGGDLRIGLPLQSLHDGQRLIHTPLRLSVFIEAPRAAIERVMAEHRTVAQLVGNGWLQLLRMNAAHMDAAAPQVERWHTDRAHNGAWVSV